MWHDLVANLAAVAALLVGGVIAAPIGAWLVFRLNPVLLGGVVGTLIVFLNLPKVLAALGVSGEGLWAVRVAVIVVGVLLSWRGVQRARTSQAKTPGPVSEDPQRRTTKVHAA